MGKQIESFHAQEEKIKTKYFLKRGLEIENAPSSSTAMQCIIRSWSIWFTLSCYLLKMKNEIYTDIQVLHVSREQLWNTAVEWVLPDIAICMFMLTLC